jgi:hypothetical protein
MAKACERAIAPAPKKPILIFSENIITGFEGSKIHLFAGVANFIRQMRLKIASPN